MKKNFLVKNFLSPKNFWYQKKKNFFLESPCSIRWGKIFFFQIFFFQKFKKVKKNFFDKNNYRSHISFSNTYKMRPLRDFCVKVEVVFLGGGWACEVNMQTEPQTHCKMACSGKIYRRGLSSISSTQIIGFG